MLITNLYNILAYSYSLHFGLATYLLHSTRHLVAIISETTGLILSTISFVVKNMDFKVKIQNKKM